MRTFIIKPGDLIPIGRAGENQATQIRFDVTGWAETFGAGTYELIMQRPGESELPYPVEVTTDGDYVVWTVSNVDAGIAGNCKVQLRYVVSDAVAKSVIYHGIVGESLDHIVDPPDPYDDLIERLEELARQTEQNAEAAARSAGNASDSADAAGRSAGNASDSADAAGRSANSAAQSVTDANAAKLAAQAAQQHAEAARAESEAIEARIMDTVPDAVADWLDEHITQETGYVIDDSLTVQGAAADAKAVGDALIDKAPIIIDTASGAIASFPDGSDAPIKQLTVGIEPVQDLHGYDNPWPAGGGKNKLNLDTDVTVLSGFVPSAVTITSEDGSATITETYYDRNANKFGWAFNVESNQDYVVSGNITTTNPATMKIYATDGSVLYTYILSSSTQTSFTFSRSFNSGTNTTLYFYVSISSWGQTITLNNLQIELGSTATAYAPYSNICPINGWDGATVTRTGKNLLSMKAYSGGTYNPVVGSVWNLVESTNQFANPSAGVYTISFTSSWSGVALICPVIQGQQYRFSYTGSSTGNCGRSCGYLDENFTVLSCMNNTDASFTYNGPWAPGSSEATKKAAYIYLLITPRSSSNATITINNPQIEFGSTATDFAPYAGTSYPITWQSEAGTVYGGTLTVEQDGSADLVAEWANIASYAGETLPGEWISDRDVYAPGTTPTTGAQVVYKLAAPVTYTLTAPQMRTLLGQNNWWADCGDIAEINYRCDTRKFVEKKILEAVSALI